MVSSHATPLKNAINIQQSSFNKAALELCTWQAATKGQASRNSSTTMHFSRVQQRHVSDAQCWITEVGHVDFGGSSAMK